MTAAPRVAVPPLARRFSTAGRSPYDEVTWELRDARLTDHRDGSVAFEQVGVEFPADWSVTASNIVAQKYFRGPLGTSRRERSLRQVIDRVVGAITSWGRRDGYFEDDGEAAAFADELRWLLLHQRLSFNSPVWFNIGVPDVAQQAAACFILDVEDDLRSILGWYEEEGIIFKGGSGAGANLSKIRSSRERLSGGGAPSGPVSFMRGADASAGTIKSGGTTRRAAKMVILDADHPDVEEFIWCKAVEERKARVLRDAGFDMDLDGTDSFSIQYQNANNSVRLSDEFMQAALAGRDWELTARTSGDVVDRVPARSILRQIAEASWECADPGVQFDTTINRWNTTPTAGRIEASNPCFTGDTLVHTDHGLVAFRELVDRVNHGEKFRVYTHDATRPGEPGSSVQLTTPDAVMVTGHHPVLRLRFANGMEVRSTANHRFFTQNRGFVRADELTDHDRVQVLDRPAPPVSASPELPVSVDSSTWRAAHDSHTPLGLPDVWDETFAHWLGWLVGDGCISGNTVTTIYGTAEERTEVLPIHQLLVEDMAGRALKTTAQPNGTTELRLSRAPFRRFLEGLGVSTGRASTTVVPWSVFQAPTDAVAAFLRGLFDADGCAVPDPSKGSYVGLGSASPELLRGVQRLLSAFGIVSRVYRTRTGGRGSGSEYTTVGGEHRRYGSRTDLFDLRITGRGVVTFARRIGFTVSHKAEALASIVEGWTKGPYRTKAWTTLSERVDGGIEITYNLSEPVNHSYVVNGLVVSNCSEHLRLANSACNLASLNLLGFLDEDGTFDVEGFEHAVRVTVTAQDILVGASDYPTDKITAEARAARDIGIGYTNLGASLMALGLPYDSEDGRAWAAAVTGLLTGAAAVRSTELAARLGPAPLYHDDAGAWAGVYRLHLDAARAVDAVEGQPDLNQRLVQLWQAAVDAVGRVGARNAELSVAAPTGCLVGGTLVPTGRGLIRLHSVANPYGERWQDLDLDVATHEGPRRATRFFVNGVSPVVRVETARGYRLAGTPEHQVKVISATGEWVWRRLADLGEGDSVPLALDQLVGDPQEVRLPPLGESYWTGEWHLSAPRFMDAELAELIGYFMGDGSLDSRGLRFSVAAGDDDVVDHLVYLGKSLFGLEATTSPRQGYTEVAFHSVRLVEWWEACGFRKLEPFDEHHGKGWKPHIPDAVLHSNDRAVYAAFIRGLFEADGTVTSGVPHWSTTDQEFCADVQALLLHLGFPTTTRWDRSGWGQSRVCVLRLLNTWFHTRFLREVGFLSVRKQTSISRSEYRQAARRDHIPVSRALIDRVFPVGHPNRAAALLSHGKGGVISRRLAARRLEETDDQELARLCGFFFDRVVRTSLAEEELTYDLSVPANVSYVANGFVSHNTISFMMDADTTGIEPDLGLVKLKKLVGGGTLQIVNQTVPRALRRLGYTDDQVGDVVAHVAEHHSALGAPHLDPSHLAVFACAMGDNVITYDGHLRMMAAIQPFFSGAMSKTVNVPEATTVDEIEQLLIDAWRSGIKCVALYRDNCKVTQPLSTGKQTAAVPATAAEAVVQVVDQVGRPVRERLPRTRRSRTFEFRVADCKGFVTVGEYDDGRPGELFIRVSKQGSTLAGIMDAFAISVSHGLQYGVPLRAFVAALVGMRFEPAGITDDPEVRIANSLIDYLFRRLALEYLPYDERVELGILGTSERTQPTLPGVEEAAVETAQGSDVQPDPPSPQHDDAPAAAAPALGSARPASDAPLCMTCGVAMTRAGSCFVCQECGTTSGCS